MIAIHENFIRIEYETHAFWGSNELICYAMKIDYENITEVYLEFLDQRNFS